MKNKAYGSLFLLLLCLFILGPSTVIAQENGDPACFLLPSQEEVTSSDNTPPSFVAVSDTICGQCSPTVCAGGWPGMSCITFFNTEGACFVTGMLCGGNTPFCRCI
ncbi:MAG TPA: hypothetical protein VN493_25580 [Thermoanaerobaculia bacterium]|nr:hypothetical protein [Thermoanaerobaculia bacterium]